MTPWLDDGDVRLYHGDALEVLRELPDASVDCVVTSPPYWGLRDYGNEGQLGLEATPDEYVANMVAVFREVRRALSDHGTCWLNLGDSYATNPGNGRGGGEKVDGGVPHYSASNKLGAGVKPKDLVGIPWRVAFALQADGWWLRSDIIWSKPNPMPESVTDRPTKSHEYVFLLTKSPRYFFDQEAVREPHNHDGRAVTTVQGGNGSLQHRDGERWPNAGRNVRSVWQIATQSYPEAHFATFPEELARRCILAGCPEFVCQTCGKPRERNYQVSTSSAGQATWNGTSAQISKGDSRPGHFVDRSVVADGWNDCDCGRDGCGTVIEYGTTEKTCHLSAGHDGPHMWGAELPKKYRPGIVLDPFVGSGTVCKVARDHERRAIGIDLSEQYLELAARRLQQLSLLSETV